MRVTVISDKTMLAQKRLASKHLRHLVVCGAAQRERIGEEDTVAAERQRHHQDQAARDRWR
jgi:hypothetical protein